MTQRQKVMLIGAVVILALAAAAMLAFGTRQEATPSPTVTASATPTPAVSLEEQERVKGFSEEFAGRYYNYLRPDDPAYLESFKPYVGAALYAELVRDNRKASRFPKIPALKSTIKSVEITEVSPDQLLVGVEMESTPTGGDSRTQTAEMTWQNLDGRWQITQLTIGGSDG